MKLSFPQWRRTPWGQATPGQWRYALRNSIAMCLALWVAFALNLDEPYWALTSAAVVSFPTVGGVISKSIGRVIGSLVGAAAAMAIAGHCLNDPWLFTLFIAGWIGGCTYISNHYQNNVSYAFALAGYTAAIIAFSTVNVTDTLQIFDIAQARVCEVITGILCGGLMMMILPSTSDGEALLTLAAPHAFTAVGTRGDVMAIRCHPTNAHLARKRYRPDPDHERAAHSGILEPLPAAAAE
ncbi:p-hydroxybenzoic acid efflux pump subunit AaeB [Serratia odorifera]|uniref:p-hydroxybenzoic acid efflux pump subunit AaeB n=1 Tax=Serratia odorifera TaxID=618 RepID=A0A3S5D805_SEROD|nr:p-hydroxybenzoic acid efflux pump subunit AaeB [Serratia odorifera]